MKIKRKPPKPAQGGRPAFVIGSSFSLPTTTDLKFWFDLEYGGPLKIEPEPGGPSFPSRFTVTHAIWSTTIISPVPEEEADRWKEQLQWGHAHAAIVLHRSAPPAQACDAQLFSGRLARGLTLLAEGTAYDVRTGAFLNPSDWKDRPLALFQLEDHVAIQPQDSEDPTSEWFRTMGLSKFGLDELETARPRGLSSTATTATLLELAATLIQTGQNLKVGSTIGLPSAGTKIQVVSHRTIPHTTGPLSIRRLQW